MPVDPLLRRPFLIALAIVAAEGFSKTITTSHVSYFTQRDTAFFDMPGPCNSKRRKKAGKKRHVSMGLAEFNSPIVDLPPVPRPESSLPSPPSSSFPIEELADDILSREPAIYDPGNGPRVKNIHAFLASSFSSPPSTDDDLCAEFAQEEVLDMLYTVLPHELAMVSPPYSRYSNSPSHPHFESVCGITKAERCPGYVQLVEDYIVWATCYPIHSNNFRTREITLDCLLNKT